MKNVIFCPNHPKHVKNILIAYDTEVIKPPLRFWAHCGDRNCRRWVQIDINVKGGATATLMSKGHHFHFDPQPVLLEVK